MASTNTEYTNRLINQSSPYLLQHAHNPVDWYPWGDEAFEKAKKENKPIFLSIGYSTCHWCHVMEKETFENEKIAAILNEHFVSIKVDREERPDIDSVYMDVVQMMTGSGGWPMSLFLTPDKEVFFAGTYFPAKDMYGRPGFETVLNAVIEAWHSKHDDIIKTAGQVSNALKQMHTQQGENEITPDVLDNGYRVLEESFDSDHGGFGGAPKFPQPSNLLFLLSYYHRTKNAKALEMVEKTLDEMAKGGIYDHLGGGFARYSTDRFWLVPHFEKMLYDQAQLAMVYTRTYQLSGNEKYAQVAREIFDYVLRDMTNEFGGFYSAEDADSQGEEGKFYVWTISEIKKALGKEESEIFNSYYSVTEGGNFEHNTNILNVKEPIASIAKRFNKTPDRIKKILAGGRKKLFDIRTRRIRPHLDDKAITAWNGLMAASMAYGGAALSEQRYIKAAQKANDFVLSKLQKDGRIFRFYRKGNSVGKGFLDDYAFLILAQLELYQATYRPGYLETAEQLADKMIELFSDKNKRGFYQSPGDAEELIIRKLSGYDGAVPSGNSVAAYVFLRLGKLTMQDRFSSRGENVLLGFGSQLKQFPLASMFMLLGADFYFGPTQEIVIAGDIEDKNTQAMLAELHKRYLPRALTIFHNSSDGGADIEKLIPFVAEQKAMQGKTTAYICQNYVCAQPVTDFNDFLSLLEN